MIIIVMINKAPLFFEEFAIWYLGEMQKNKSPLRNEKKTKGE